MLHLCSQCLVNQGDHPLVQRQFVQLQTKPVSMELRDHFYKRMASIADSQPIVDCVLVFIYPWGRMMLSRDSKARDFFCDLTPGDLIVDLLRGVGKVVFRGPTITTKCQNVCRTSIPWVQDKFDIGRK